MVDRTYTRVTVPLSVVADSAKAEAVRSAFGCTIIHFHAILLCAPLSDEASGHDSIAVRLVDGRPCLVYEEEDCNWGGTEIEDTFINAGIPFIQVNATGEEYGPSSTVFDGTTSEVIRLGHDLKPVVSIGVIDGRVTVDAQEIADYTRYLGLRSAVLLWPALALA